MQHQGRRLCLYRATVASPFLVALCLIICSLSPVAAPAGAAGATPVAAPVTGAHPGPLASPGPAVDADYRLSPGDVVQVAVFGEPTLSGAFRIGPGGSISLPIVGQINLQGLRLRDAQRLVTQRVGTIVRRPSVTVAVDENASVRRVYLSGELARTGGVTLPFGSTLTDALAVAGPGPFADLRRVRLTHPGGRPIEVDCSGLRGEGPLGNEHRLEYGDTIHVPRVEQEISIMGEVQAPGTALLPVGRKVTVIDALRMSQGFTPLADRSRAVLIRAGADPIAIDLERLLRHGEVDQNRILQGGDVLVVHRAESIGVAGHVQAPRVFQSSAAVPVLQALAAAGGPLPTGDLSRAQILRDGRRTTVDLQRFMDEGEASEEYNLRPGDVLVVPGGEAQNLLILGALARTGVFGLRGVTQRDLLRVITVSGPGAGTDLSRVVVYRGNQALVRNLKALMEDGALEQNLELEPGDIVFAPPRQIHSVLVGGAVGRRGVMQIGRDEDHDLLRIVTLAGPGDISDLSRVMVYRGEETFVRDLKAAMEEGRLGESMMLREGDVVYVPEKEQTLVLSGALQRSGIVRIVDDRWRDLATLVSMSGPLAVADLTRVSIHRGDEEMVVDVRAYLDRGDPAGTMQLQPGDVVRVPLMQDSVLLTGATARGGVIRLYEGMDRDLLSLVLAAGPTPMADLERVTVHRGEERIVRNLRAFAEGGDRSQTLTVMPGDIISVPGQQVHNVLVTGAVARSGLLQVVDEQRRDLARFLTLVGPLPNADLSRVTVHRGGLSTTRDVGTYFESGLDTHTLLLEDGDVVNVPRGDHSVLVMGAVMRAGTLQLFEETQRDLLRVITLAGPTATADLGQVTVYRGRETYVRDLRQLAREGDLTQTMMLQEGDIVRVPHYEASVLLVGALSRVGVMGLGEPEQRDLARVILSSGPLPQADLRRVMVHRGDETLVRDVWAFSREGDRSQTLQLEDGDVVMIPVDRSTAMVTGALTRGGSISVTDPERRDLAEILIMAVPLATADLRNVTVFRGDEETVHDMSGLRSEAIPMPSVVIMPGDRVFVPGLDSTTVLMTGAVSRPGTMEIAMPDQRDLAKAVMASGPSPTADLSRVTLFRGEEASVYDLRAYLEQGDVTQTTELQDGDRVLVPDLSSGGIMVMGQVMRQGALPIGVGQRPDLFAAVTMAGPLPQTADLSRVRVHRAGETLERNLRRLREEGDISQNLQLEMGDVVYVPESTDTVVFMGEVERRGPLNIYALRQRDLAHVLPMAGPRPDAGLDRIRIYRDGEILTSDYVALAERGDISQNIELVPGDIIYVPPDDVNNVMVLGALNRTGLINVRERANRDLLRIVSIMGPLPTADLSRVTVFRPDREPVYRDLQRLQDEGDLDQNMEVAPGDVIVVPRLDEMYIVGAVTRPGAYPVQPNWTVLDAITAAGGIAAVGKHELTLIRRGPDGSTESIRIDMRRLGQGRAPEPVRVRPGDILFVPGTSRPTNVWTLLRDTLGFVGFLDRIFSWF